jgi:hypothetical protein
MIQKFFVGVLIDAEDLAARGGRSIRGVPSQPFMNTC